MSDFEFVFALYGLLLGLSLAEVLGGLARTIEVRLRPGSALRVGWLTPLLGAFVLLDLLSFWRAAWLVRDTILVSGHALLGVTAFASAYYLAAHLVFPRDVEAAGDLDAHFRRIRRVVIGILLVLFSSQMLWYATIPALQSQLLRPWSLGLTTVLAILMIAAMSTRSDRWSRVVMAALVARYVGAYLVF
ncbi:hypothetical protein ASE86_12730 [Sphingomonas sp. Leaf33]|uniref:hypothetical protein n=1 Tax=Sphingomonas sp. Leaf33 TaxID=1736215 RepID=UPI0006F48A7D|nr:hypothetical protein [Sphingomonas sp. Leaf33]KQN19353.1 hypothetical protein ASE86_12730 [Sphingomonas sp. Leaf33]